MTAKRRLAVGIVVGLVILGVALTTTAGAHVTDVADDPVSTVGHICDQLGLHNDWGDHHHGDTWAEHPHHDGAVGQQPGPHGPHHGSHGPHHGQGW